MKKIISICIVLVIVVVATCTVAAQSTTISHSYLNRTERCSYHAACAVDGQISVETWQGNTLKDTNYNSGFTSDLSCSEYCFNSDHGFHAAIYTGLYNDSSYGWDY